MVFVPKVNYVTGTRVYLTDEERIAEGLKPGPIIVVTNLCVMESRERGIWNVVSLHKGVTAKDVVDSTGFAVNVPNGCPETRAPTQQEVDLIKRIDPTGIHLLDFISGKERATRLPAILQAEWDGV